MVETNKTTSDTYLLLLFLFQSFLTVIILSIVYYIIVGLLLKRFNINYNNIFVNIQDYKNFKFEFAITVALLFYYNLLINGLPILILKNYQYPIAKVWDVLKYIFLYFILLPLLFYLINKYILCGIITSNLDKYKLALTSRNIIWFILLFFVLIQIIISSDIIIKVDYLLEKLTKINYKYIKYLKYILLFLPLIPILYIILNSDINGLNSPIDFLNKYINKYNLIILYLIYLISIIFIINIINSVYELITKKKNNTNIIKNICIFIFIILFYCLIYYFKSKYNNDFLNKCCNYIVVKDQFLILFLILMIIFNIFLYKFYNNRNISSSVYIGPILISLIFIIFKYIIQVFNKNHIIILLILFIIINYLTFNYNYKKNIIDDKSIYYKKF